MYVRHHWTASAAVKFDCPTCSGLKQQETRKYGGLDARTANARGLLVHSQHVFDTLGQDSFLVDLG